MSLELVPLSLVEARRFVAEHHRHAEPPLSHKFSIGICEAGELVGVVMVGRPITRGMDDGRTVELLRVTTTGSRNACSRLYGAACRAAAAIGYRRAITYTMVEEGGASLRAAGFSPARVSNGDGIYRRSGGAPRAADKLRLFDPPKLAPGPKVRWEREL